MMIFVLMIWLLVELFVVVKVAEWIGVLWMLVLLAASLPIGWSIMRHEGRAALAKLSEAFSTGQKPAAAVIEGVLVIAGGLLLMIPGFLSDIAGGLLLIRPTRRIAGRAVARSKRSHRLGRLAAFAGTFGQSSSRRPPQHYDAEGTAFDVKERHLKR